VFRSDGLLLAYLVSRRQPGSRAAVQRTLREVERSGGSFGQALIRRKLLSPQEFIYLQGVIEQARRLCAGCGRELVVFPGPQPKKRRCGTCRHQNRIGAVVQVDSRDQAAAATARLRAGSARAPRAVSSRRAGPGSSRRAAPGSSRRAGPGASSRRAAPVSSRRSAAATDERTRADASRATSRHPKRIGPYEITRSIGEGGMGLIFKAVDPSTGRPVAIKVLRSDASEDAKTRFQREAESLARLSHPAIVKVHDVGVDRGRRYFAMEYVRGRDLNDLRGRLDRRGWVDLVARVAEGLHHAHEHGIVHRDLKPHNIMIDQRGAPRLADFGLARDLGRSSLTEVGDLVGTPLYMSPEQLRGDPTAVDRRTDVYAVGVLLYEGLTGRFPFEAGSLYELQRRVQQESPRRPSELEPGIDRHLDRILLKALEREAQDRYQTAAELARDLRTWLAGGEVETRPVAPARRFGRRTVRWLRSAGGVATVVVLAVVGVTVGLLLDERDAEVEAAAQREAEQRQRGRAMELVREGNKDLAEARLAVAQAEWARARDLARAVQADVAELAGLVAELGDAAPVDAVAAAADFGVEARRVEARALAHGGFAAREEARAIYEELLERLTGDVDLLVGAGYVALRDDHLRRATDLLHRAVTEDPERSDAFFWRGEAHRRAGRARYAVVDYERALANVRTLGPITTVRVRAARALAYVDLGETAAAERDVDAAEQLDPNDPRVRLARIALLQAEPELATEALLELDQLARDAPGVADVRLACARAWAAAGDATRAAEELDAAIDLEPGPAAWIARARLRSIGGDDAGAEADLALALARSRPGDPGRLRLRLVEGRHHRARGRAAEARAALDAALADVEALGGDALRAALRLERAEALVAGDGPAAARGDIEVALAVRPGDARALLDRAGLDLRTGGAAAARALAARVVAGDPGPAVAARGLAIRAAAERLLDDPAAAETAAEAARASRTLLRGPTDHDRLAVGAPAEEARTALALGRRHLHRAGRRPDPDESLERALALLRRAGTLAPWLTPARIAEAEALIALERVDEAYERLSDLPPVMPVTWDVHALRGRLLAAHGEDALAVEELQAALAALARLGAAGEPVRAEQAGLFVERARSYRAVGALEAARDDLDAAVTLDSKRVEAFALRAAVRRALGDSAGAAADRERVELLEEGYVDVYEAAIAAAWRAAQDGGRHGDAVRALAPAFEVLSPERDPVRAANAFYVRAYMHLRAFAIPEAVVDLACMTELAPYGFQQVYDEVVTFEDNGAGLDVEAVLGAIDVESAPGDADPDFLRGFEAFLAVEFMRPEDGQDRRLRHVRPGLAALGRYLDRHPGNVSAQLIRAVLYQALRQPADARRALGAALELVVPPAYAHYLDARLRAAQGEVEGGLAALERALTGGFCAYREIETDRSLDALRDDPRFERLLDLSQGLGYLRDVERVEPKARVRGPEGARRIYVQIARSTTAGLRFLRELVAARDGEARLVAARLHLARARQAHRLGDRGSVARDVAAALEATPRILLDYGQVVAAREHAGAVSAHRYLDAEAESEEALPGRFRAVVPVLLDALDGESPGADALAEAAAAIERLRPRLVHPEAYLSLLALAEGDAARALELARTVGEARAAEPLAAWLAARAHAARGEVADAVEALRTAVSGGLEGPLERDPALGPLRLEDAFLGVQAAARDRDPRPWEE